MSSYLVDRWVSGWLDNSIIQTRNSVWHGWVGWCVGVLVGGLRVFGQSLGE